jgi:uncharacterized protein
MLDCDTHAQGKDRHELMRKVEAHQGRTALWGITLGLGLLLFVPGSLPGNADTLIGCPVISLAAFWLFVHFYERRRCRELGGGWRSVAWFERGAQTGAALVLLPLLIWWFAGLYMPGNIASWDMFSATVAGFIGLGTVAILEEIACRGLLMRCLELKAGSWIALVASSLLFALGHLLNGGESLFTQADRALVGLSLGAAFLLTRRLWMSIGLHAFHNLVGAAFFGDKAVIPLFTGTFVGSPYWTEQTGGHIVYVATSAAVAALLIAIAWRRGCFISSREAWQKHMDSRRATTTDSEGEMVGDVGIEPTTSSLSS